MYLFAWRQFQTSAPCQQLVQNHMVHPKCIFIKLTKHVTTTDLLFNGEQKTTQRLDH
jgi:hypothetical protein